MNVEFLIEEMERALAKMREALEDPKSYGILLQYSNYEFNCGMYYAYLDIFSEVETELGKYVELCDKHKAELDALAKIADEKYIILKERRK